jgi:hypothetical protein
MPVIQAALERGQRVRLTVNGGSMLPFLRDGDVVELEPVRNGVAPGDVVLVKNSQEQYALHRVVRAKGDALFIRGDAQLQVEGPFTGRDVLGKAVVSVSCRGGVARALDRGFWRFAGVVWARCGAVGPGLVRIGLNIRAKARSEVGGRSQALDLALQRTEDGSRKSEVGNLNRE